MRTRARLYVGAAEEAEAQRAEWQLQIEAREQEQARAAAEAEAQRAEWQRQIEAREQEQAQAARVAPVQEAAPVGAPVQEAAHVANAQTQRVLVLYRTDLGSHNDVVPRVGDHYAFLRFLIEQGFSYTEPDRDNNGLVYERVRPE